MEQTCKELNTVPFFIFLESFLNLSSYFLIYGGVAKPGQMRRRILRKIEILRNLRPAKAKTSRTLA